MSATQETEPLQRGSSALVIARNIRNEIEAGRLAHGQQLPSTRSLADDWGTSVATINRAMGLLADEGLVVNKARSSRLVNYPSGTADSGKASRPQVVLVGGYAGSGKTELGRILTKLTGWAMLDKDTTTRHVVEAALDLLGKSPNDRESDTYFEHIRPAEYESLNAAISENVMCGNSVIATAPFVRELADQAWSDRFSANLASLGADLHVIWVRCDLNSMRSYLRHRGAARDAWKLDHWSDWSQSIDPKFEPVIPHQVIDNSVGSRPLQQQAAEFLTLVRA